MKIMKTGRRCRLFSLHALPVLHGKFFSEFLRWFCASKSDKIKKKNGQKRSKSAQKAINIAKNGQKTLKKAKNGPKQPKNTQKRRNITI